MRNKTLRIVFVTCAWLVTVGCLDTLVDIGGPTQVNQQQGSGPGGGPLASPSPNGGDALVASVKIGEFGEVCPAGKDPAEFIARQVREGCTAAITCTPKDASGRELPNATPPHLDFFNVVAGESHVRVTERGDGMGFNLDVTGISNGVSVFLCRVAGVSSDPWALDVVP